MARSSGQTVNSLLSLLRSIRKKKVLLVRGRFVVSEPRPQQQGLSNPLSCRFTALVHYGRWHRSDPSDPSRCPNVP